MAKSKEQRKISRKKFERNEERIELLKRELETSDQVVEDVSEDEGYLPESTDIASEIERTKERIARMKLVIQRDNKHWNSRLKANDEYHDVEYQINASKKFQIANLDKQITDS